MSTISQIRETSLNKGGLLLGHLSLALLVSSVIYALATPIGAQTPKKDGQTIFGENRKATLKAMRDIAKALGKKCTYCHVKEGGKLVYEVDTPHKQVAREMKFAFIDSLVAKGRTKVSYPDHGKTMIVSARYVAEGDDAGIHLMAAEEGAEEQHHIRIPLPAKGEALSCNTCHGGKVHIWAPKKE